VTKLPATYFGAVEAQALDYAKKLVAWYRDKHWFSPHSVLSPEAAHAVTQQHLKQRALEHPNHMLHIIKKARAGYQDAQKAMLDLVNTEYYHRGRAPPPQLVAFQMDWNAGLIHKRTRDNVDNFLRNIIIASMVWELSAKFCLKPTRRSPRHPSGCSILAIAIASELPRGMIKPGERAVETIWKEWNELAVPSVA
jgi:hypothetical protein